MYERTTVKRTVSLGARRDPECFWDGNRRTIYVPLHAVEVYNIEEASEVCKEFIQTYGLGEYNWIGGEIKENGKTVGLVSFSGKVLDLNGQEVVTIWPHLYMRYVNQDRVEVYDGTN